MNFITRALRGKQRTEVPEGGLGGSPVLMDDPLPEAVSSAEGPDEDASPRACRCCGGRCSGGAAEVGAEVDEGEVSV